MKVQLVKVIGNVYILSVDEIYIIVDKSSYKKYTKDTIKIIRIEYRTRKIKQSMIDEYHLNNCIVIWRYINKRDKLYETPEHLIGDDLALMDFLSKI